MSGIDLWPSDCGGGGVGICSGGGGACCSGGGGARGHAHLHTNSIFLSLLGTRTAEALAVVYTVGCVKIVLLTADYTALAAVQNLCS